MQFNIGDLVNLRGIQGLGLVLKTHAPNLVWVQRNSGKLGIWWLIEDLELVNRAV